MTIETICNLLLAALAEAGLKESTLFNYKGAVRRFKAFCGFFITSDYVESTFARKIQNYFGFLLAYSYLCTR